MDVWAVVGCGVGVDAGGDLDLLCKGAWSRVGHFWLEIQVCLLLMLLSRIHHNRYRFMTISELQTCLFYVVETSYVENNDSCKTINVVHLWCNHKWFLAQTSEIRPLQSLSLKYCTIVDGARPRSACVEFLLGPQCMQVQGMLSCGLYGCSSFPLVVKEWSLWASCIWMENFPRAAATRMLKQFKLGLKYCWGRFEVVKLHFVRNECLDQFTVQQENSLQLGTVLIDYRRQRML